MKGQLMFHGNAKWTVDELSQAMANAIFQRANNRLLRQQGDIVKFNGFWRDGDKQNVCAWLNTATWHDIKTGVGGGCKEFAKAAFNMDLPEFMKRYGRSTSGSETLDVARAFTKPPPHQKISLNKPIEQIFKDLSQQDKNRDDKAKAWLENERALKNPRFYIGSGFANLIKEDVDIFENQHQNFIRQRLAVSDQIIVPLRGVHSDKVQNLFFRSIGECSKEEKSRLLPNAGGWSELDSSPRAFGFPHLINDFPNLVICEGMADYFAAELLLDCEHNFLPIGVASASALPKWAHWLAENKFNGCVIIIFHLDQDRYGNLSDTGIGQDNAVKCASYLRSAGIDAKLFPWLRFLKHLNNFTEVRDLADVLKLASKPAHLPKVFLQTIHEEVNA
jgi:hypothetical protein